MPELFVSKKPLEDAMKLASMSTESVDNLIVGHCLFDSKDQILTILATDKKSRLSKSTLGITGIGDPFQFTADPRKILKLIKSAESDTIRFSFDKETLTLQVFTSDDSESFISLPSFDPASYAPVSENFDKSFDLKTLNADVFLGGMQFIKGFLLDKHQKFSNMFISNGIMYGANGNNKAGAFSCTDFEGLDELVFPLPTFPVILNLIGNLQMQEITIGSSSNHIFVSSPKKDFIFGFTKVQMKMPKIPLNVEEPDASGWKIDRSTMIKKLSRLHLTGDAKLGVRLVIDDEDKIKITTVIDRPSKDVLPCKRVKGVEQANCITEVRLLEATLTQFGGDEIDLFIGPGKINVYSKANLEVTEGGNKVLKPFISAAAVALSQES